MNHSIRFLLPILIISAVSCGLKTVKQNVLASDVGTENIAIANRGMTTFASPYDVKETANRLENIISEKGLTLFARIDHSANAKDAELELNPTEVLIIGNPKVGTPLMQCSITTAIDLPQKILVYQDESDRTQVAYNNPEYLKQRHHIEGCDSVLEKVAGVLENITQNAIQ